MVIVRLLLLVALAIIVIAGIAYLFTKDRRYLRFIGLALKYTLYLLAGTLLFFAIERLVLN